MTVSPPSPAPKTPEQIQIEELEARLADEKRLSQGLTIQMAEMRGIVQHQQQEIRGYIEQDIVAGKKWRDKFEAAAVELRLRQKTGLTSGCTCPIGVCLGGRSTALEGACWVAWAEGWVLKRTGEIKIDELRTQASHPARVAAALRARSLGLTGPKKPDT